MKEIQGHKFRSGDRPILVDYDKVSTSLKLIPLKIFQCSYRSRTQEILLERMSILIRVKKEKQIHQKEIDLPGVQGADHLITEEKKDEIGI